MDFGGQNMTTLFALRPDSTFVVNQLPYYQAALPVFYLYLEMVTGQKPYGNQTIPTGPILVTNDTVKAALAYVEERPFSAKTTQSHLGAFIPNAKGDTYGRNMLAGMDHLAQKLGWTISDGIKVRMEKVTAYRLVLTITKSNSLLINYCVMFVVRLIIPVSIVFM